MFRRLRRGALYTASWNANGLRPQERRLDRECFMNNEPRPMRSSETRRRFAAAAVILIVSAVSVAQAQLSYPWSFERLQALADCVVIADYVRTADTGRRTTGLEAKPGFSGVELETQFRVLAVLKGCAGETATGSTITLKHYRSEREDGLNGPSRLDFTSQYSSYLMYLRLLGPGTFEPLSGHVTPTTSILRVAKPF